MKKLKLDVAELDVYKEEVEIRKQINVTLHSNTPQPQSHHHPTFHWGKKN